MLRVKDSMEVEDAGGNQVALVKKAIISPVRDRFTVKVKNGPDLEVKGNLLDHEYTIGEGRDKVAEVSKKWFRVRDTYGVDIEPGRDDVVILAGGSMSATAVKEGAGARTQVTNLVTWIAAILTLLFLTPLFAPLPEAVLAALIIHAVWHIIASRKLMKVRLESRTEAWFGLLALAGVLLIDVLQGMIIGLVASLVFVIYRTSRPHVASLGRVPGVPGAYSDLTRHPENVPVPGVLIVRLDGQVYYANAQSTREHVKALIAERESPPRAVIFDAASQEELDVTSTDMLRRLVQELHGAGIDVYLAEVHAPVLEGARRTGLLALIGEGHFFPTVDVAVRHIEAGTDD
jgi:SulP family sulfate permease